MKGRTDSLIINHQNSDIEILVFYRKRKYEYPGAGFQFKGRFLYQSHTGKYPASFILQKAFCVDDTTVIERHLEQAGDFSTMDVKDGQNKILASIVRRRGQAAFRAKLMQAYSGRCAVTDCELEEVLEAAHIVPYMGTETNHVQNGLLLRSDIHTLFNLYLIIINPDNYEISISTNLIGSDYARLAGEKVRIPALVIQQPSRDALRIRQSHVATRRHEYLTTLFVQ